MASRWLHLQPWLLSNMTSFYDLVSLAYTWARLWRQTCAYYADDSCYQLLMDVGEAKCCPSASYCQHFVARRRRLESPWKLPSDQALSLATTANMSDSTLNSDLCERKKAISQSLFAVSGWLVTVVVAMSDVDEPESPSATTSASTVRTRSRTGASPADDPTSAPTSGSLLGTCFVDHTQCNVAVSFIYFSAIHGR